MKPITIGLTFLFASALAAQNGHDYFFRKESAQDEQKVLETTFPESSSVSEGDVPWPEKDVSPNFPELQIFDRLDPEKSMESVKQARLYFLDAAKAEKAGDDEAKTLEEKMNERPVQYGWQRREKEESLKRQQSLARLRAKRKAIGFTVKALETLEHVKNPGVLVSSYYVDLKARIIRQYVRLQLATGNISGVIELIDDYFKLKKEHQQEAEPYRVLAIVYRKLELMAQATRAEKEFNLYKKLKNDNLLKFTEQAYGKDSNEYDFIRARIASDNIERLP